MTDIVEFLKDRLAQDEQLVRDALNIPWHKRLRLRMSLILRRATS